MAMFASGLNSSTNFKLLVRGYKGKAQQAYTMTTYFVVEKNKT